MLIGSTNTVQLKTIVRNYLLRNAEELATFSVYPELNQICETKLRDLYQILQIAESKIQNEILRHPLLKICLQSFSDYVINTNDYFRNRAVAHINILEALFFDCNILEKSNLKTDNNGKIYLPISKIIIELPIQWHSIPISIEKTDKGIKINGHSIFFENLPFTSIFEKAEMKFRIWSLRNAVFNIDSISFPYIENAPDDWKIKTITSENLTEWNTVISKAAEVINASSQNQIAWSEVNYLIKSLIPVESFNSQRHLSCSSINAPGIVCMSYTEEPIQIAQAMIHEAGHNKLFLFEFTDSLITTNKEAKLKSPWRTDLRPPRGLLHGAFAFGGIAVAWRNILNESNLNESSINRILPECISLKKQINEALNTLRTNCELTELGNSICDSISKEMNTINFTESISVKQNPINKSEVEFIDKSSEDIFDEFKELEDIYLALQKEFDANIQFKEFPDWIERMSKQGIEKYFHYAIPLYEFCKGEKNLIQILYAQILSSLIWRFQDYILDNQIETPKKEFDSTKASFYFLIKLVEAITKLNINLSYVQVKEFFEFGDYSIENELKENLSVVDIWKRGSPLLLMPRTILNSEEFCENYKAFINLIGLIGDIPDYEIDKIREINTWVTKTAKDKEDAKNNEIIHNSLAEIQNKLFSYTQNKFPIWHSLVHLHLKKLDTASVQPTK